MAQITPAQYKRKLREYAEAIQDARGASEIAGIKTLEALMKSRIFNANKTTSGASLGRYRSAAWARKRQAAGRQTSVKDLEFTGGLRRNLQTGTLEGHAALGWTLQKYRVWADGHEKQVRKLIYQPSTSEIKDMLKAMQVTIVRRLKRALA